MVGGDVLLHRWNDDPRFPDVTCVATLFQGLTENQNRLLYMVSLYTHKADTRHEKDHWLRKPALVVLLYEGIVANILDFDYAPQSELIENRRIWLNVSQV